MTRQRSAAVFCATVAAMCRLLSWHQICRQCSAVLRKPFLLSLRQFSARRSAPMAGRAASEHPHQCQLAPVCCTAVQLLEQLACGPIRSRQRCRRSLRSFFRTRLPEPKAAFAGGSTPRSRRLAQVAVAVVYYSFQAARCRDGRSLNPRLQNEGPRERRNAQGSGLGGLRRVGRS